MKIGVMTSGGDCSGMNACLSVISKECKKNGVELIAFVGGFQGIIDCKFENWSGKTVSNISHLGGSVIKSSRCPQFMTKKGQAQAVETLRGLEIDCLIAIGGNGTQKGLEVLTEQNIAVIAIPGTIDNDVSHTEKTLGFDTALNCAVEACDRIRETMSSMNRGCVVEIMGRDCGDLTTLCAVAVDANAAVIKEMDFDFESLKNKIMADLQAGEKSPLVLVAENQFNIEGLAKKLEEETKTTFKSSSLGYIQRGGSPTVADRILAKQFGKMAVLNAIKGLPSHAIGVVNGKIECFSIEKANAMTKKVSKEMFALID